LRCVEEEREEPKDRMTMSTDSYPKRSGNISPVCDLHAMCLFDFPFGTDPSSHSFCSDLLTSKVTRSISGAYSSQLVVRRTRMS
jgi:hypothetical protein